MRIITAIMGDIFSFPPIMSLLHAFEEMDVDSVLISTKPSSSLDDFVKTKVEIMDINYEDISSPIRKLINISSISHQIWNSIDKYYNDDSIIWVVSDVTIKYLGKQIYERRYILHLLELSENLVYYPKFPMLRMNKHRLGMSALAIVVPEYNRAHITKAWWGLSELPFVLPNKPYNKKNIQKNAVIEDPVAKKVIEDIGIKKIILYQGIMSPERPLDVFIDAVDEYNGEYAFVVMSGGENIYKESSSTNYYFIPFVTPPKHLQITSHAHIGVLSYVPTDSTGYSPLNSLYCAPNKTFEYSMFGIPMLGNDIPGLKFLFETKKCGACFKTFTKSDVCNAIEFIERNYMELSSNSLDYYNGCDYKEILSGIIMKLQRNEK